MQPEVKQETAGHNGDVAERWTPERRRQHTRDVLIDAATQVFAEKGFEAASLEEIAEAAGYSRGAIYKNFGGKEELFLAVHRRFNERALASIGEAIEEHGIGMDPGFIPELARLWRAMFFQAPEIYALGLEFRLYVLRHPEVQPHVAEEGRDIIELVAQYMEEQARAAGVVLPYPTDVLARMLVAASDGFQEAYWRDPDGPDLVTPFLDLFMRAVGPAPYEGAEKA